MNESESNRLVLSDSLVRGQYRLSFPQVGFQPVAYLVKPCHAVVEVDLCNFVALTAYRVRPVHWRPTKVTDVNGMSVVMNV